MTDELAVNQPASDAAPVENVQAPAAPSPAPEKVDNVQKRIDRLTWEKNEYRRQLDELRARPESKAPAPEPLKPPTKADHDYDDDKYQAALIAYTEQIAEKKAQELLEKHERNRQESAKQRTFQERQDAFIKSKPDYREKVTENESLPITPEMAQVIRESEMGPELAYYLAENEDKAAAISQLSPFLQARELGRIEALLESQKAAPAAAPAEKPKVTAAPPPVPKIEVTESSTRKDWNDPELSYEEFNKRRRAVIAQRK
jgi:hypothetical protein